MKVYPSTENLTISVNAKDLAQLLLLATRYESVREELKTTQAANARMRAELRRDHEHFNKAKNGGEI